VAGRCKLCGREDLHTLAVRPARASRYSGAWGAKTPVVPANPLDPGCERSFDTPQGRRQRAAPPPPSPPTLSAYNGLRRVETSATL
jgi:hypothetical protein